jgi:hypothetical protein
MHRAAVKDTTTLAKGAAHRPSKTINQRMDRKPNSSVIPLEPCPVFEKGASITDKLSRCSNQLVIKPSSVSHLPAEQLHHYLSLSVMLADVILASCICLVYTKILTKNSVKQLGQCVAPRLRLTQLKTNFAATHPKNKWCMFLFSG